MIILGLDPGSRITGYGLINKSGDKYKHIDNGPIRCKPKDSFADRLAFIFLEVQKVIQKYQPEVVAVEQIFHAHNISSALKLGQARGSAIAAATSLKLPLHEYSALQVKSAVTGYGRATKDQVQKMVKTLLNLPEVAEENASDALAVALCHGQSFRMNKFIKK